MTATTLLPSSPHMSIYLPSLSPRKTPIRPIQPHRPKLSLNTASTTQTRTLGRGNTSLRLDTTGHTSPTRRNTFANAYEGRTPSTYHTPRESAPSPNSSPLSSSSSSTDTETVPYSTSSTTRSILKNGPVSRHPSFHTPLTSLPFRERRTFLQRTKRVTFRPDLTEEVKNIRFTLAHSDLLSEEEWSRGKSEAGEKWSSCARLSAKRESPVDEDTSSDEERQPKTPTASRSKRRREWVWTLGEGEGEGTEGQEDTPMADDPA